MVVFRLRSKAYAPVDSAGGGAGAASRMGPIDPEAIARLRELDPTGQARLLERVIDAYLGSADRLMAQLHEAQARGDTAAMRMVAHTLKSSSASLGATSLASACAHAEALARDQRVGHELDAAVTGMSRLMAEALLALRAMKHDLAR
jgi:HPt (histidine-containing phosphotransfer) domain-containing protein